MGCWAVGGAWGDPGTKVGWEGVNERDSREAIEAAVDNGINLFDTADSYGVGNSETLLGKVIRGRRDSVVVATKFGHCFEEGKNFIGKTDASPEYMRTALEGSLRRLGTDYIDLYQLHIWEYPVEKVARVVETLERFVSEGKIRGYGWSTDVLKGVMAFDRGAQCNAAQILLNVFEGSEGVLRYAEKKKLSVLCHSPLAMGLLSGEYPTQRALPKNDIRALNEGWIVWFKDGKPTPEYQKRLEAVREILTAGGRSLVQGALGWIWAKSPAAIPIPGCMTAAQAIENAGAMSFGPLDGASMKEIEKLVPFRDTTAQPEAQRPPSSEKGSPRFRKGIKKVARRFGLEDVLSRLARAVRGKA
jgi:aryl-alcohol dehydrogenase-like predicted oxidoreductase